MSGPAGLILLGFPVVGCDRFGQAGAFLFCSAQLGGGLPPRLWVEVVEGGIKAGYTELPSKIVDLADGEMGERESTTFNRNLV